jgi:hypothetical protein
LDHFLAILSPDISMARLSNGTAYLISLLTLEVEISNKDDDVFLKNLEKSIFELDAIAEQSACTISAAFTFPYQIFGLITQPFYGFLTHDEFQRVPKSKKNESPFFPTITRSVDVVRAGQVLRERPEAARLLAGAVNASRPTAKLVSNMRIFEAAFKKSGEELKGTSFLFLDKANLEYSKTEIDHWIHCRHRVAHADNKSRVMFDSDVYSLIPRVSQAALDIVFNKKIWRNKSTDRLEPTSLGTTFSGQEMRLTVGVYTAFNIITTDLFGRFPVSPQGVSLNMLDIVPALEKKACKVFDGALTHDGYAKRSEIIENRR